MFCRIGLFFWIIFTFFNNVLFSDASQRLSNLLTMDVISSIKNLFFKQENFSIEDAIKNSLRCGKNFEEVDRSIIDSSISKICNFKIYLDSDRSISVFAKFNLFPRSGVERCYYKITNKCCTTASN